MSLFDLMQRADPDCRAADPLHVCTSRDGKAIEAGGQCWRVLSDEQYQAALPPKGGRR